MTILSAIAWLSFAAWVYLAFFHGGFWRANQVLPGGRGGLSSAPRVVACIPARDEAETIGAVVTSHLRSTFPGGYHVVLVDDHSSDGTGDIARQVEEDAGSANPVSLRIVSAPKLEMGWTGKLWALRQAVEKAQQYWPDADYYLFTDADIVYEPDALERLVAHARQGGYALTSVMAKLDARGVWASVLIPAFVYFFQKLYPFARVNDGGNPTAGAAGGCALVHVQSLLDAGGLETIKGELIDDCALARSIKGTPPRRRIWLGFDSGVRSLRDNRSLASVWNMVARTAYTQLNYSILLLVGTVFGMTLIYLVPPVSIAAFPLHQNEEVLLAGCLGYFLMALTFIPTLKGYDKPALFAFLLPLAALAYTAMTIHSAIRHWRGRGGMWKGRSYSGPSTIP